MFDCINGDLPNNERYESIDHDLMIGMRLDSGSIQYRLYCVHKEVKELPKLPTIRDSIEDNAIMYNMKVLLRQTNTIHHPTVVKTKVE